MDDANPAEPLMLPNGFRSYVANAGIKDSTDDFLVIAAERKCSASAMFTQSTFAGPSVTISRQSAANGELQAIVLVSKNANVANGRRGLDDAMELRDGVAVALGCDPSDVLVASTGVIGVPYPMSRLRKQLRLIGDRLGAPDAVSVATAMMTTDTHPKMASTTIATLAGGTASVVGVAKGVGMIEPDMATMLAFLFSDAEVDSDALDAAFRRAVERSFNSLSVDTDTSTSDTAAILTSGAAGQVDITDLEKALHAVCLDLTKQLAADGEGAEKLIQVNVSGALDDAQAKRVAKSVINSPLVKTAVHGCDPNWGRVVMAIGKNPEPGIDQDTVRVSFSDMEVYPATDVVPLDRLKEYLAGSVVEISIDLNIGGGSWTVYGCDLTDGYIRINADYTT